MLVVISLILAGIFLLSFFRAVSQGQFDDDHTPSVRVLFEEEVIKSNNNKK